MADMLSVARVDIPIGIDAEGRAVYFDRSFYQSFFKALLARVSAGQTALTNAELEDAVNVVLTEMVFARAPADFVPGDITASLGVEAALPDLVFQMSPGSDLGDLVYQPH